MEKATRKQLKDLRDLVRDKKVRDEKHLFVAEGIKIVTDMFKKGHMPVSVLLSDVLADKKESSELAREFESSGVPVNFTREADINKISDLKNSQGIVAVMRKSEPVDFTEVAGRTVVVLCDGVQDPGNLGAMIRTSAAFNASGILLTGETVDPYNPKVVRASSGTLLDLPVKTCDLEQVVSLRNEGYRLLVSMPEAPTSLDVSELIQFQGPVIVCFGSEARGVSLRLSELADDYFTISIHESVESLNVTVAAAITLFVLSKAQHR
ncbi:MAG: hypothetical protein GF409_08825 [Candidatus Omnitrophica bacterium]|nr:hypothetical protein [Candidatus Omnitrophota bacterium]